MPDYAIVAVEEGLALHAANCPAARRAADDGVPVLTMFDASPFGAEQLEMFADVGCPECPEGLT